MDPVFSTLCFSSPLRTTALSLLNRELCLNSLTLRGHSASMVMASPHPSQLWGTHLVKISLLLLCNSMAVPSQMPCRSAEAHRAPEESGGQSQANVQGLHGPSVPPPALGSGSPTLAKMPTKLQLKSKLYLFSPCAKCISVLRVVLLLPVMETHPASASKQ